MAVRQTILSAALAAVLLVEPCHADVLHLVNGGRVEGTVTRIRDGWRIDTGNGVSEFRDEDIARYEQKPTPEQEYLTRSESVAPDDFDGQMAIGRWCRGKNLNERAQYHFMIAVALRPDDKKARRSAGFVRDGNEWITREEMLHRQGLREYNGKWLPVAEALRLQVEAEEKAEREETYAAVWARLRESAREDLSRDPTPHVEFILTHDPRFVIEPLVRASRDGSPRVRRVAMAVMARLTDYESLQTLASVLERERDAQLLPALHEAFALRQDRQAVLRVLLERMLNHRSRRIRRRACRVAEAVGDKRVMDVLVPQVAKGVTTSSNQQTVEPAKVDGVNVDRGMTAPSKTYYPAHEALVYITGELLPREEDIWSRWWAARRESFVFRRKVLLPEDEEEDAEESAEPDMTLSESLATPVVSPLDPATPQADAATTAAE